MAAKQKGFTLIELVVVIAVLGILASFAIPRYTTYVKEARVAALNGLAGAIRSSVAVVQARYLTIGTNTSPVTMLDGTTVGVSVDTASGGVPLSAAGGIDNAVKVDGTYVYTPGATTGTYNLATAVTGCTLTYTAATGSVSLTTTGC